jgi:hypothetical protein
MLDEAYLASKTLKRHPPALRLVTSSVSVDNFVHLLWMIPLGDMSSGGRAVNGPVGPVSVGSRIRFEKSALDVSQKQRILA